MKILLAVICILVCLTAWAGAAENETSEAQPVLNTADDNAGPLQAEAGRNEPVGREAAADALEPAHEPAAFVDPDLPYLARGSIAHSTVPVSQPDNPSVSVLQYQALGRNFVLPLVREVGLVPIGGQGPNDPAWQLLAEAWNQARLLPHEVLASWAEGEVNIYLAIMANQANGRWVSAPVEDRADFIGGQFWAEYNSNLDISSLAAGKTAGVGVFARNDDNIYALSVRRAQPVQAEDAPAQMVAENSPKQAEGEPDTPSDLQLLQAMMVSSISVVNGIPVAVGVGTNTPATVSADHLFNICHNITLYLALSNHLPPSGFFNPDMESLVIAGRKLKLPLPPGNCLLRANTPRQAVTLIQWERFYSETHNLIAAYAPCDKLAAWQDGPENGHLAYYGLLAVNLYDGQLQLVNDAREFARNLRQEQQGQALQAAKLDEVDWPEAIREMPVGAIEVLGHMGMERNVAYWPVVLRVFGADPQASGVLAGVLGVGTINGLAVTNALYMPIEEKNVYTTLLNRQKAMFSAFR